MSMGEKKHVGILLFEGIGASEITNRTIAQINWDLINTLHWQKYINNFFMAKHVT